MLRDAVLDVRCVLVCVYSVSSGGEGSCVPHKHHYSTYMLSVATVRWEYWGGMSLSTTNRVQLAGLTVATYAAEAQCAVCAAQFGIVVALFRGFTAVATQCPKLGTDSAPQSVWLLQHHSPIVGDVDLSDWCPGCQARCRSSRVSGPRVALLLVRHPGGMVALLRVNLQLRY